MLLLATVSNSNSNNIQGGTLKNVIGYSLVDIIKQIVWVVGGSIFKPLKVTGVFKNSSKKNSSIKNIIITS